MVFTGRTSSRAMLVNEARGAKDTLGILFWGVIHKRFGVIKSGDFCYDLKSLLSNRSFSYLVLLIYEVTLPDSLFRCDPIWGCYRLVSEPSVHPIHSSSSIVTYTSVYTDSEPGRIFWGADEELSDGGSPRVIVYGYNGLPMQPVVPPSLDYVPGPEHPPSPDYVPGPEHPPSPVEDEEPFKDEDDDEEEEHLAPADSSVVPVVDPVPSAGDTEAFQTDESAPTPRSPQTKVPFAQTHLRRARKTVRLEPPMSPFMEARIAEYAAVPTPPSPPPSPLSPWEDVLEAELPPRKKLYPTTPTSRYEVGESSTAAPRPTGCHRADYGFIGTLDAEIRCQRAEEVGYGIRDVWVDPIEAVEEVAPTTLEGVNARVTELAAVQEQDT
ncbi:hypothetical protein Tco_1523883 [Tanacetum coccineum]